MRCMPQFALAPLLALVLAVPAWAGTVYVPHPGSVQVGGVEYETQVWASNTDGSQKRRLEHFFIPSNADGTERDQGPVVVRIAPGRTVRLEVEPEGSGLLEIFAAPQVVISARLVEKLPGPAPLVGTQLPVIDSDNLAEAGETVHLQGWERIQNVISTTLGIALLSEEAGHCTVEVFRADGSQIDTTALLSFEALSHHQFDEALEILKAGDVKDVRSVVSCDQPFFSYVSLYGKDPTGVVFVLPSASGGSDLRRPGEKEEFVYLSDVPWSSTANLEYGPWADRTGVEGGHGTPRRTGYKKIEINGQVYEKGVSWMGLWGDSAVTWNLGGEYRRFTTLVRIDDSGRNLHEWGRIDSEGNILEIPRPVPPSESPSVFRIGAGGSVRIFGDGQLLYQSPDFYAYGEPLEVDLDVTGVQTLRIVFVPDHVERPDAPHRKGLSVQRPTKRCPWWDFLVFPDAKLFPADGS